MSFSAVAALLWFYDTFRTKLQDLYKESGIIKKSLLYILGIAATTIIAGNATAFYGLYHFQTWSVYSLLANVLALPVMSLVIMPAAILSYITMPFDLAWFPLSIMERGVQWIIYVASWVADLEGAVLKISSISPYALGLFTLGFLMLAIGPAGMRVLGASCLICFMILLATPKPEASLLINAHGDLVGYYDSREESLYLSTRRSAKRAGADWAQRRGMEEKDIRGFSDHTAITCDSDGCRWQLEQIRIATPKNFYSLKQDCSWADIIVTVLPQKENYCRASLIIDYQYIKDNGSVRIDLNEGQFYHVSDRTNRGVRPWTVYK
jgi:competence protein ComEC